MTILSSTANVISDEDYLVFPSHPKFDYQPDGLIGFGDWVCSGIWVGTGEEKKEEVSSGISAATGRRRSVHDFAFLLTFVSHSSISLPLLPLPPNRNERRPLIFPRPLRT
jgi:hypothetical protein